MYHLMVKVFNGIPDGRVFDARSIVVVNGRPGDVVMPFTNRKDQGTIQWTKNDVEKVKELR